MKKRRNKSINRRIGVTFLLVIIIMSMSFLYSNIMKDRVVEEYNLYMKINIKLSNLSVNFNDSFASFDSYVKTPDAAILEKFLKANGEIESIMEEVSPYIRQDKNSSIFLRDLVNMYEWYKEKTSLVISRGKLDAETYEQYVKIGRMNFYISQHSQNLISTFLQFTDSYYSSILDKYDDLDSNLYILLIITIVISALLIWLVTYDIIRTIINLSRSVKLLSESNWNIPDLEEQSYKELNNLTKTFNHMKNKLRDFIAQLNEKAEIEKNYHLEKLKGAEKDKLIKDTQLKALQMQINPHFMFNNLNTVSRMAMFEAADKTVDLIGALSKILRYNLISRDKLVRLTEEIENVKAYILIQKTKFEDNISFEFNIEKEIEQIKIPPMIIQLLVENSIIHGVSGLDKKGIIKVKGRMEEGFAIITVEDNGKGFAPEDETDRANKTTTGLGLANIRKRLELYFYRSDLLSIESKEGQGTKISILIPLKEGEKIAEDINS
jgi:sensor histidine kinase YesM